MRDPVYPLPELLDPGLWEIQELDEGGHVIPEDRIVAVPLEATPHARAVRAHELAHICFSPPRIDFEFLEVGRFTLLAVEDARVNELAGRTGLEVIADLDDPTAAAPDPRVDLRAATLLLIASHATRGFERIFAAYESAGGAGRLACNLALRVLEPIVSPDAEPGFEVAVDGARLLGSYFGPEPPEWANFGRCHTHTGKGRGGKSGDPPRSLYRGRGRWGALRRIEEPPRPVIGQRRGYATAPRASEEGSILRAPHRLIVDGRVFARRARRRLGSVLIDASSSMNWSARKLETLLEVAPAAIVACYEGAAEGWGVLRVLARDGRRVAENAIRPPLGKGGNVVDGPALRWLARQPPPRVWVSDGHVTGVGDHFTPHLLRDAEQICAAARIVRVPDANAARLALSRQQR